MSSTSAVSGSAGQTMITFLTETSSALGPVSQQRVFNYQITSDAQTYYEQEMAIIQYALLDGTSPPINGVAAPLDTSGTGGNLNEAIVQTVQAAMQALNTWSQYQYVTQTVFNTQTLLPSP